MSYVIEEERGTVTAARHRHNGYYAGDFGSQPTRPAPRSVKLQGRQLRA